LFSSAHTLLLLEEYRKLKDQFRDPKIKKKDFWNKIRDVFSENGYNPTADNLDKKFRNLKRNYIEVH